MSTTTMRITDKNEVKSFLLQAHIARMATVDPGTLQPHVVPVWYEWDGETLWISSFRSTRKVKEIQKNPQISVVIDSDSAGEPARAVVFEGEAELISDAGEGLSRGLSIYTRYLGIKGAQGEEPQSWLHDPEHLLIALKPRKVYAWGFG